MQLQDLPSHLPMEVRRWAEVLRELADASGEPTAASLADNLHIAQATLCRYLQGQRPQAALANVGPGLIKRAQEHSRCTRTLEELQLLCDQAAEASGTREGAAMKSITGDITTAASSPPTPPNTVEDHKTADPGSDRADTSDSPPGRRQNNVTAVLVAAAVLLLSAGAYWLWGMPNSGQAALPAVPSDTPGTPGPTATSPSASSVPAPQRRCARVTAPTSPVWVNPDDTEPLKWKAEGERVRLLDLPSMVSPKGTFQAVHLPQGSPTGHGWMPAGDLIPTSCANQP